ncbi:MAG: cob(I)yrinic acid a,c-diamide adenosyltransferase [bacterium]
MKIYTKTGDQGETSLFGGDRVGKDVLRIETYGTVDELNSMIGVARSFKPPSELETILQLLQNDLFVLGSDLATPLDEDRAQVPRINKQHIVELESIIDRIDGQLAPLKAFILPGGSAVAAHLHTARTVCRRAERLTVRLMKEVKIGDAALVYLNRLSDLLFVLARYANKLDSTNETIWNPPK